MTMKASRFFRIAACLPIALPLLGLAWLAASDITRLGDGGQWLGALALSLWFGGVPYLLCALLWFLRYRNRPARTYLRSSLVAPLVVAPVAALFWLATNLLRGFAGDVALANSAFVAVSTLLVGYVYVAIADLTYLGWRLAGLVDPGAGLRVLAALGAGALLACATTLSQDDVDQRLRLVGRSVAGASAEFLTLPVHADSQVAEWTLLAEAKSEDGSSMGRALNHDFRRSIQRPITVVVGGPWPDLTRVVVLEAWVLQEREQRPNLTLIYVGPEKYAAELGDVTRRHGARFVHREMP
jgi:hypothetical protein